MRALASHRREVGDDVDLADEKDIDRLFKDCEHGAVPPVGECYGLDVIVDDSIGEYPTCIWTPGITRRSFT